MLPDLNPQQTLAVHYLDGPLLVIAGAGSGKTRVITQKIAYLIATVGIPARNIVAVTFTNKAAREMKTRVSTLLKGKPHPGLTISTFHNLGLTLLRQELRHLGYRPQFSILDAEDSTHLLAELLRLESGSTPETGTLIQTHISQWKNDLVLPAQALSQAADEAEYRSAQWYERYQQQLRAYNAFDFDDLILQPVTLLLEQPEVLARWRHKIHYLLVDEYQDTNTAQYRFIQLLVGDRAAFTAVGDDDQSVYTWRGARPENLQQLSQDFPTLKVVALEQNYRSTGRILKAANHLIAHNPHLFKKTLWSQLGPGDKLRILLCPNGEQEVRRVVSELLLHQFKHNTRWSDYAILYRGNHQARAIEKGLREHRIPYYLSGGMSFFAYTEVKDIMAYLRLLANPQDDAAFLRVINIPRREIGPTTLEKLGQYAQQRKISLFHACQELGLEQHLRPRALQTLRQFAQWLSTLAPAGQSTDPIATIKTLMAQLDYATWLGETSGSDKAAANRMQNVAELIAWLERLYHDENRPEAQSLGDLIAHLTLVDILERQDEDNRDNQVSLMTLHAAKGLEFPYVFMMGMEEELLPHRESLKDDKLEEERRLAYVGITRAQKQLTFTLAAKRQRYGEIIDCEPSRFLQELPAEDLEWHGKKTEDPVTAHAKGQAHLATLRAMLGNR